MLEFAVDADEVFDMGCEVGKSKSSKPSPLVEATVLDSGEGLATPLPETDDSGNNEVTEGF